MAGWRRWCGCLLVLVLWALWIVPASAHAVLERADPPANASLQQAPRQVVLRFTEPIDPALSSLIVIDRDGKRISGRTVVSADRRSASTALPPLAEGIFAVRWRVLSTVDGHATSGVYVFAVGLSLQLVPGGSGTDAPDPLTVAVRWITLAAAVVLTGSLIFPLAVLGPALAGRWSDGLHAGLAGDAPVRRLRLIAAAVLMAGTGASLLLQAGELLDAPAWRAITSSTLWSLLVGTKRGWGALLQSSLALLLLVRPSPRGRVIQAMGLVFIGGIALLAAVFGSLAALVSSTHTLHLLLVILAAVLYGLLNVARRPGHAAWLPVLAAVGILGGFTMTSHAAGAGVAPIAADWLHLAATGVWIGGLVTLLVTLGAAERPFRRALARAIVPRFSGVAGVALAVLILTGTYSAWVHMPALRAFADTPYGRALLVKLVIVVPLVALGAVNRFVIVPMLRDEDGTRAPLVGTFLRFVGGEVFLAATVLAAVAVLTITPPARLTLPGPAPADAQHLAGYADDVHVALIVSPAKPGWNRFEVTTRLAGGPIGGDARVLLRLTRLDEPLDPVLVRLAPQQGGRHVVEAGEMAVSGWWDLEVVVRRPGRQDVATTFPLRLGEAAAASEDADALALVERARRTAAALRAWRERLQLADGRGGAALTTFAVQAPDRMHYRTPEGTEAIVIGRARYFRTDSGAWERDTIAEPFVAQGPLAYLKEMHGVTRGRLTSCGDEQCQVVLWGWDSTTAFAALIGLETGRVHRIVMVAPGHFMTVVYSDFNGAVRVVAPR